MIFHLSFMAFCPPFYMYTSAVWRLEQCAARVCLTGSRRMVPNPQGECTSLAARGHPRMEDHKRQTCGLQDTNPAPSQTTLEMYLACSHDHTLPKQQTLDGGMNTVEQCFEWGADCDHCLLSGTPRPFARTLQSNVCSFVHLHYCRRLVPGCYCAPMSHSTRVDRGVNSK